MQHVLAKRCMMSCNVSRRCVSGLHLPAAPSRFLRLRTAMSLSLDTALISGQQGNEMERCSPLSRAQLSQCHDALIPRLIFPCHACMHCGGKAQELAARIRIGSWLTFRTCVEALRQAATQQFFGGVNTPGVAIEPKNDRHFLLPVCWSSQHSLTRHHHLRQVWLRYPIEQASPARAHACTPCHRPARMSLS